MKLSANAKRYKRNHKAAGGDGWEEAYRAEGQARKEAADLAAKEAEVQASKEAEETSQA